MEPMNFGRWIKKLRAQHDLTQEMLAELVGCATPTLRAFEIGLRRPSREMAERIADVLKVPDDQHAEFVRLARLPLESQQSAPAERGVAQPQSSAPVTLTMAARGVPPTTPMIGREAERHTLQTLLLNERNRLVTIVGAGGMGKTRLALDLTSTLAPHFADGAGFVALAAINQVQHLPSAIAGSLNIPLHGVTDLQQQVNAWLAGRKLLLTLDNFEQLLPQPEVVDWVRQLLLAAPHLHLLVTSRERLRVSNERVFELAGLALPGPQTPIDQSDAALLFLDRAQQVDSRFSLNASNRSAISQICHLVGGMPLGIELAAAWVHVLTPAEIGAEITRSLDFLARSDRDMPPRHRTLRAVFEHSWDLLSAEEQQGLMKLSVFRGGCTREAAQAVAGATLPVLASLIDKSLLGKSQDMPTRYTLHELVRQYAWEHLQRDPVTAAATIAAHGGYYCTFVCARFAEMQDHRQQASVAAIDRDLDNVRLAWQWAITANQVEPLLQMALPYWFYLDLKDFYQEGEDTFRQARLHAQAQLPVVTDTSNAVSVEAQSRLERLVGHTSTHEAYFYLRRVRLNEARRLLLPAIALLQKHNDPAILLMAHWNLGNTQWFHGDFAEAAQNYSEALALSRQGGNTHRMLMLSIFAGGIRHEQGDYGAAYAQIAEAVREAQRVDIARLIAYGAWCLGRTARQLGRSQEVVPLLQQGLSVARATEDWFCVGLCLEELAGAATVQGDLAAAATMMQESVEVQRRIGDQWSQSRALVQLGNIARQVGNLTAARQHLREALHMAYQSELLPHVLDALLGFAQLAENQGERLLALLLAQTVTAHAASSAATRQAAGHLLTAITAQLSPSEQSLRSTHLSNTTLQAVISQLLHGREG